MSAQRSGFTAAFLLLLVAAAAAPQSTPPQKPPATPPQPEVAAEPHDISGVDAALPGSIIAIPPPEQQRRKMKNYEVPELVGARQALGSQLVGGELPRPLLDYSVLSRAVEQRISFFDGGLVVVAMDGPGGAMRKKVILPGDALIAYRKSLTADALAAISSDEMTPPSPDRRSRLRVYRADGSHAEIQFDPRGLVPKGLLDQLRPLEDLLRVISEDRTVTNSIAGYMPAVGDELVSDDRKTWRVEHVIQESGMVELRCLSEPTVIYVDRKSLYNYFIGKRASER